MKKAELLNIIDNWESKNKAYAQFDFSYLEAYSNKDSKFEEGMVSFIVNTLSGDLAILDIDFRQKDWKNFRNSLNKIKSKFQMIGAMRLVEICEGLTERSKIPFIKNQMRDDVELLKMGSKQAITSLHSLFNTSETIIRKIA